VHDETVREDVYGYQDVKSERGLELWARVGIRLLSERIWTDAGAGRVFDAAAFERAMRRQVALEHAAARAVKQVATIEDRVLRKGDEAQGSDIARLVTANSHASRIKDELTAARHECESLKSDPARRLVIPDGSRLTAVPTPEDVEAIIRGDTSPDLPRRAAMVREWITVTELGRLFAVSVATARRWVTSGRGPKQAPEVVVDLTCGRKRRRIPVSCLNLDQLTLGQKEMLAQLLSRWPIEENWSQADCETPIASPVVPPTTRMKVDRSNTPAALRQRAA
jgi:hypothetical protein